MKKKLLFAGSIFFLLVVFFFSTKRAAEKDILLAQNSFIDGLEIINKKDGNKVWTLSAERADIMESEDKALLSNISMTIEDKGMTIQAPDGVYDLAQKDLSLNGQIIAITKDYTITADSVEWNQSREEIIAKGNVKIEGKKFNVEGSGLEADSGQKMRILKNVKATFYR